MGGARSKVRRKWQGGMKKEMVNGREVVDMHDCVKYETERTSEFRGYCPCLASQL